MVDFCWSNRVAPALRRQSYRPSKVIVSCVIKLRLSRVALQVGTEYGREK